jgi:cytochrome c biogenesis protein CcmG/thiol:disulfide interchange protein DsbE
MSRRRKKRISGNERPAAVSRTALGLLLLGFALGCRDAAPPIAEPAPAFDLPLVGGGRVSLDSLRGEPVLLDFWATWCEPCLLEIEELNALQEELRPTGVRILAISIDTLPPEQLARWVAEHGIRYPVALASVDLATAYGADAFPFHVLLGPDGTVRERLESGFHDRVELRALVARHETPR